MKIAFFELKDWEKEYVTQQLKDFALSFFDEPLSQENVDKVKDVQVVSAFVDSPMDKALIEKMPKLKMIAARSTGFDHIDVAFCKEKNITVCNVPTYGENTVAEHAFALILDLSRKIHQSIESVKSVGFSVKGLMGFDLKGKTIGVVGMGNIGKHVARIAQGFEMNVVVFDVHQDKKLAKQLKFSYASLEDLLKVADIITLHVPFNEHTKHLINAQNMGLVKKGAYLINTSRGGIVETDALVKALDDGTLAGAGLDVLEEECFIKEEGQLLSHKIPATCDIKTLLENHVLMERDNVIITLHNAFNSQEALERILHTTVENVGSFIKGRPGNVVTA